MRKLERERRRGKRKARKERHKLWKVVVGGVVPFFFFSLPTLSTLSLPLYTSSLSVLFILGKKRGGSTFTK